MSMGEMETALRLGTNFVTCIFNNAASGYVKALQHSVFGPGQYQSSDLTELDYSAIGKAMGCHGIRVTDPDKLSNALREGLDNTSSPTIIDIVVTRDPQKCFQAWITARSKCRRVIDPSKNRKLRIPYHYAHSLSL
jgi:acetolactate synthase I/II/III large subunit